MNIEQVAEIYYRKPLLVSRCRRQDMRQNFITFSLMSRVSLYQDFQFCYIYDNTVAGKCVSMSRVMHASCLDKTIFLA